MRIKKAENEMNQSKALAIEKNKKKDKRGAMAALRKSKMYEKELTKLDGQSMMLEQQVMQLEAATTDGSVIKTMKGNQDAMDQLQKQVGAEDFEKVKERMEDA